MIVLAAVAGRQIEVVHQLQAAQTAFAILAARIGGRCPAMQVAEQIVPFGQAEQFIAAILVIDIEAQTAVAAQRRIFGRLAAHDRAGAAAFGLDGQIEHFGIMRDHGLFGRELQFTRIELDQAFTAIFEQEVAVFFLFGFGGDDAEIAAAGVGDQVDIAAGPAARSAADGRAKVEIIDQHTAPFGRRLVLVNRLIGEAGHAIGIVVVSLGRQIFGEPFQFGLRELPTRSIAKSADLAFTAVSDQLIGGHPEFLGGFFQRQKLAGHSLKDSTNKTSD